MRNYVCVGCVRKCRIISHSQQETKCHCEMSTFPLSWWELCGNAIANIVWGSWNMILTAILV